MKAIRWFLLWLFLAALIAAIGGGPSLNYWRLSRNGIPIQGIALARRPHWQIKYSFEINGHKYEGTGRTGIGAPFFNQISIGDIVPVYYLPAAPDINCLGDPKKLWANELVPWMGSLILFPTMIVCRLIYRGKQRDSRSQKA
ncbi:MAG TPA: hypothetical protein VKZ53_04415 [Candidatus Angelobacter sp.]|nr:hypothetical protein [Candidatus Angelobacter sp.]